MSLLQDNLNYSWIHPQDGSLEHKNNFILSFLSEGGSGRLHFWQNAIAIIERYPLWGSGLNTYTRMLERYSLSLWYAHNCYLQWAAETGVVGLVSFLWMLYVFFSKGLTSLKVTQDTVWNKAILQGVLAGLSGFLVESFLDNALYMVQLGILFWVMLALAMVLVQLNSRLGTFNTV